MEPELIADDDRWDWPKRFDRAMTELAFANQRNAKLRAEIVRHGWALDCSRCAALIDGRDGDASDS